MNEKELKRLLKLLTPNQLQKICRYLLIDDYYPILEDYYLRREKIFNIEYKHNLGKNSIIKILRFCREKIILALKDDDFINLFGDFFK